jgi:hypothetical protein
MDCQQPTLTHAQRTRIAELRWLNANSHTWNIAVTWHVPNEMRTYYNGYNQTWRHIEDWLSNEMRKYLNTVDRAIYKAAHKNRSIRLPRIITLEHTETVGWHAHGIISNPLHLDEQTTQNILAKHWHKHVARFATERFEKRLFLAEPINGNYLGYITKHTKDLEGTKGFIDLANTYLP